MKKQVNEISLERALALLGKRKIKEKNLIKLLERIKAFCKVSYQLYLKGIHPDKAPAVVKQLDIEPPDTFTKAA